MATAASKLPSPAFQNCAIKLLHLHPHNPRGEVTLDSVTDLVASVKEKGIVVPLIVVARKSGGYVIVAGHRRHKAAQIAKLRTVPIIVRDLLPLEQEEMMLLENIQRENLTPLQEAKAFQRLVEQGATQRTIVRDLGLTPHRVSSRLSILQFPEEVQVMFGGYDLPVSVIPHLLKVSSPVKQLQLATLVNERQVTVKELGEVVERMARERRKELHAPIVKNAPTAKTKHITPGNTPRVEAPRSLLGQEAKVSDYNPLFEFPVQEQKPGRIPIPTRERVPYSHW